MHGPHYGWGMCQALAMLLVPDKMYQQYKEFYTRQGRTKGKIPGFRYIHRLKVKEHYLGVPSNVAEMLSHPIEGEVQDIDHITEQEVI